MRYCLSALASIILLVMIGCSSLEPIVDDQIIIPINKSGVTADTGTYIWGLYDISINAELAQADIVPVRRGEFELNALAFLEAPGSIPSLTLSDLEIARPEVDCTVNIRHPFNGLTEFSGFMVRGVVLTDGSMSGFTDPDIVMSGPDELCLKNADGYTRWMNPAHTQAHSIHINFSLMA